MGGFRLARNITEAEVLELPISSNAVTEGDLLELTAGSATWADCTSSSDHFTRKAIAVETVASTASVVKAVLLRENDLVIAETVNNSAAADNGDRMALTDTNTVNNSGTDVTGQAVCFIQFSPVGAAADKRILGWVLVGSGVDPDAA